MAENMSDFECVKDERKSKVWQFFLLNKKERKAKCISCSHILIMRKDGSTCQMQSHLKSKLCKNKKTKSSDKSKRFQPKIIDVMSLANDASEDIMMTEGLDGQEKTFLNEEVGNDQMTNRQSIMEENLLDDHPKIIGYNCNPNAKKTFASPLIKQEIKKALNSKPVEEREKFNENVSWKKCPLCQCSFSVRSIIDQVHEDLNNHMDNCEEFQKIFKKPQKYCPICQREPKNSIILHIKRHILGGSDSSESSDDSDSDDIIIISDTDDNDSIDSGVHNDTNDFTNNLNLVPSSTPTKNVQTNKILKNNANIFEPILETQNCETEDIIPLELFPRVELKEPKPLILSYYECPLPGNTCSKWRSLEDAIAHVETYHRMSMDVFGRMPGIKLAPKILK